MPYLFGEEYTRQELLALVGHPDQICRIERLQYAEGPENGVEVLKFHTGCGFDFDVLPGRGMDLSHASFQGIPLAWISACGIPHSRHFEPPGLGWLRSFYGGLVSTCGLLNAGSPGSDPDHDTIYAGVGTEDTEVVKLGLHGRVNNTPARNVSVDAMWDDDDYLLTASGRVREAIVFGEHVELHRRVMAIMGDPSIYLHDEVTNHGHDSVPHMMLYHINLGWPLVSPVSRLITSGSGVEARDDIAAPGLPECYRFEVPQSSYPEQVFYHRLEADDEGYAHAAIVNPEMLGGLGFRISYTADTLPEFIQWKSMKRGTYVCGLEPANCRVTGRADERAAGRLQFLEPGETVQYDLILSVLPGNDVCDLFSDEYGGLRAVR